MKTLSKTLFAAALLSTATGCEKFLDINQNPNAFTPESVTPDVVLAQALNTTGGLYAGGTVGGATGSVQNFNSYSSWAAGYWSKTNTINGYAEEQTYNYTTTFYANLFNNTYDNLNDYNIIQANGAVAYPNHAAIARIMKAYDYLLLVDQYGDIPYSQALKGAANVTPTYDKAQDIYKDLLVQLAGAVADIKATPSNARGVGAEDIVFKGNMTSWQQFANSLRMRILLRESQTNDAALTADVKSQLQALKTADGGFITADVVVQPGFAQNQNQQNPFYNRYAYTQAGVAATERNYQVPTQYILDQYKNNNDPRLSQLYTLGATLIGGVVTPGYVGGILGEGTPPAASGTPTPLTRVASRFRGQEASTPGASIPGGIFKGFNQPLPLMLLSEQLFNKAEVETRGLNGSVDDAAAKQGYLDGIKASFLYYYRAAATTPTTLAVATNATPGITQYNTYIATTTGTGSNIANPLVNYDFATRNGALGKQAIIIYQKYLALNSVASTEAWDDFRRTGLPKIPLALQATAGKFPTRLLYPLSEAGTNSGNVPSGVDQFTKIFWDVVD